MLYAFTSCSLFSVQGTVFLAEETDGVEGSNPTPIGVFDYNKEPNSRYIGMDYVGPVYYLDDTYYVYKYNGDLYAIHDLDLSYPAYKNSSVLTLSQTMSKTYYSESASSFSSSFGASVDKGFVQASLELTECVSRTRGKEFALSSECSYIIDSDDPVGYYKIGVCHNVSKFFVRVGATPATFEMVLPREDMPYFALLYCSNSPSGTYERA